MGIVCMPLDLPILDTGDRSRSGKDASLGVCHSQLPIVERSDVFNNKSHFRDTAAAFLREQKCLCLSHHSTGQYEIDATSSHNSFKIIHIVFKVP